MGRSGLRWGHGGDQGGLHQPLQVWAGGDGCHRGDKVGTGNGQICAEVLKQNRKKKVEVSEQVSDTGGASSLSVACSRERNIRVRDCLCLPVCISSEIKALPIFSLKFCSAAFLLHPTAAFPLSLQHHSLERGFDINIPDVCADAGAAPESPE